MNIAPNPHAANAALKPLDSSSHGGKTSKVIILNIFEIIPAMPLPRNKTAI